MYLVGGSVRDFLLGKSPKDYDLVTSASPGEILALFPEGLDVGRAFGVIKIPLSRISAEIAIDDDERFLEIATFRADGEYLDGRRPSEVVFGDPYSDVLRRDFTINGLLYDFKSKRILDAVGGVEDLAAKKLRTIGDARARFHEDGLRILRAIRFAARFGLSLDPTLYSGIQAERARLRKVSQERVRDELVSLFSGPGIQIGYEMLRDLELWPLILPEALGIKAELFGEWERSGIPRSEELIFSLLFSAQVGERDEAVLQSICDRMKLSKAVSHTVKKVLLELPRMSEAFRMRDAKLIRWIAEPHFPVLLDLYRLRALVEGGDFMTAEFYLGLLRDLSLEPPLGAPLLSGEDLIELGFKPSRRFSEVLREVEDERIEGRISTREDAIEFVINHF